MTSRPQSRGAPSNPSSRPHSRRASGAISDSDLAAQNASAKSSIPALPELPHASNAVVATKQDGGSRPGTAASTVRCREPSLRTSVKGSSTISLSGGAARVADNNQIVVDSNGMDGKSDARPTSRLANPRQQSTTQIASRKSSTAPSPSPTESRPKTAAVPVSDGRCNMDDELPEYKPLSTEPAAEPSIATDKRVTEPPAPDQPPTSNLESLSTKTAFQDSPKEHCSEEESIYIRCIPVEQIEGFLKGTVTQLTPTLMPVTSTTYIALSYKWQPTDQCLKAPIYFQPPLNLPAQQWTSCSATLPILQALLTIAHSENVSWIWMDSFCIDQSPTPQGRADKTHFIPLMSLIFASAYLVAGYASAVEDSGLSEGGEASAEYYERVWILQEMVLAKRLDIFRGRWRSLEEEMVFWCKEVWAGCKLLAATGEMSEGAKKGVRVLGQLSAACRGRPSVAGSSGSSKQTPLTMAQIARLLANRDCLVPQDRVYGILGILPFHSKLVPNYQEPLEQVWEQLCREAILEHGDLSLCLTKRNFYSPPPPNNSNQNSAVPAAPNIVLGPLEAPEVSLSFQMTWASPPPVTYNPSDSTWTFTKPLKSTVKLMERTPIKTAQATLLQYPKALKFLAEDFEKLLDSNGFWPASEERSKKLNWIINAFFETQTMVESANGWKVILSVEEPRVKGEDELVVYLPSSRNDLKVGQSVFVVYMGCEAVRTNRWVLLDDEGKAIQTFTTLVEQKEEGKAKNGWMTSEKLLDGYEIEKLLPYDKICFAKSKKDQSLVSIQKTELSTKSLEECKDILRELSIEIILSSHPNITDWAYAQPSWKVQAKEEVKEYVVTRWYRSPEFMLDNTCCLPSVDIWSAACVFAEIIKRIPLFPGGDYLNQIKLFTQLLGRPSDEVLLRMVGEADENRKQSLLKIPETPAKSFRDNFPSISADGVDLLQKMLQFDPLKRVGAGETLGHKYFNELRDPTFETTAKEVMKLDVGMLESIESVERELVRVLGEFSKGVHG
ncbi:hypothetical protein HDV05_002452 [Chytridiales sp. JEL 0842]|nr:hypothetical protein HDV05_002452 [Chytridiales sp. JEL 0842]